jgi:hypothetical protein
MKMHHMRKPKMRGRSSRPLSGHQDHKQYSETNDVGRIDSRCRHNVQYLKQFVDKFNNFARESIASGDRIAAESFYQHADHYQRILNERLQDRLAVEKAQREVEGVQDESRNVYPIDAANVANSSNVSGDEEKPAAKPVARSGRAARVVE